MTERPVAALSGSVPPLLLSLAHLIITTSLLAAWRAFSLHRLATLDWHVMRDDWRQFLVLPLALHALWAFVRLERATAPAVEICAEDCEGDRR